ncbi:hypothetical protein, partial [Actinomadura sp. GC306]|uniref:hypothetical protein n=1 Tax=Actinomadura sp. GC306 TaxID=2530367 RepID=UPI001404913F
PGPPPGPYQGPPPAPRVTVLGLLGRQWMVVALVVGCCYLSLTGISFAGAYTTLNREPTTAELQRASRKEVAQRWRTWSAHRIFPGRIPYVPGDGHTEYASRTGIVPGTGCSQAAEPEIAEIVARHGCRAVLRATYVDQLEGVAVTVGVAVFADPFKADRAYKELPRTKSSQGSGSVSPALHAAPFPGTASARFDDAARQHRTIDRGGPYVVLTTSGQTDGRPADTVKKKRPGAPFALSPQLGHAVARALAAKSLPDCSRPEWQC